MFRLCLPRFLQVLGVRFVGSEFRSIVFACTEWLAYFTGAVSKQMSSLVVFPGVGTLRYSG
jgi:hypothetical protein